MDAWGFKLLHQMVVKSRQELSHPCTSVYRVVESEFSRRQEFDSIVLLVVAESLEIVLHHLVVTLCLSVCL